MVVAFVSKALIMVSDDVSPREIKGIVMVGI